MRITVTCTCGNWLVDADKPPERCPGCGAEARRDTRATDYIAAPWEELDARGRMFGVFAAEGYSPCPIAMFATEDMAAEWLTWQESRGDERSIGNVDYAIAPVDSLDGHVWNSHEPPPEPTT